MLSGEKEDDCTSRNSASYSQANRAADISRRWRERCSGVAYLEAVDGIRVRRNSGELNASHTRPLLPSGVVKIARLPAVVSSIGSIALYVSSSLRTSRASVRKTRDAGSPRMRPVAGGGLTDEPFLPSKASRG